MKTTICLTIDTELKAKAHKALKNKGMTLSGFVNNKLKEVIKNN